ncbi:MAG: alpha-E domain-containing protein [Oceanipulchritudo sp.]
MLSRIADSLYWMSRYVERAENTARLLVSRLPLKTGGGGPDTRGTLGFWEPVLERYGGLSLYYSLYPEPDRTSPVAFLVSDADNPDSIRSSIGRAHENALLARSRISNDLWKTINDMWQTISAVHTPGQTDGISANPAKMIIKASLLFQALTDSTLPHDEGYSFIQAGKLLERASQTSRLLEIGITTPSPTSTTEAADNSRWRALLHSCNAFEAFHKSFPGDPSPARIVEFLLSSASFPRSIRFSLAGLEEHLENLIRWTNPPAAGQALEVTATLLSEIRSPSLREVPPSETSPFLASLNEKLARLNNTIIQTSIFREDHDPDEKSAQEQQQQ